LSNIPFGATQVLDKGYVKLVALTHDVTYREDGTVDLSATTELRAVADARVSTAKSATTLDAGAKRTLGFLLREEHTSPFRGQVATFEVKAPLFVARQWHRYIIGHEHDETGSGDSFYAINESSRRYVESEPEFYIPEKWRKAPERRSQGSGTEHEDSVGLAAEMLAVVRGGVQSYELALRDGVCAEQARLFLPAYAMYTSWRWTGSLQGICHFLSQRLSHDAQSEIREYAAAVRDIVQQVWPETVAVLGAPKAPAGGA